MSLAKDRFDACSSRQDNHWTSIGMRTDRQLFRFIYIMIECMSDSCYYWGEPDKPTARFEGLIHDTCTKHVYVQLNIRDVTLRI